MAALTANHYPRKWQNDSADKCALYALQGAVTGDTIDVGQDFLIVKQAILLATTITLAFTCAVSANTVLTMPAGLGGASPDAGYVLVWGVSA